MTLTLLKNKHISPEKFNSLFTLVGLMTLLGYMYSNSINVIVSGVVTLGVVYLIYKSNQKEGFLSKNSELSESNSEELEENKKVLENPKDFTLPKENNPLMNVLMTDYQDDPLRKPAAPSFNPLIEKEINEKVPVDPRIFKDLGDSLSFENSMRNFNSTPNTQIPNDQMAFAKFCYGDMRSCKEGDPFQCIKNNTQNIKVVY
uniref:Uncharacterized protein n=1 Tax=viral metagenome TaxID=1070528 RepID=A0A6C0KEJ8_9ZZZZ